VNGCKEYIYGFKEYICVFKEYICRSSASVSSVNGCKESICVFKEYVYVFKEHIYIDRLLQRHGRINLRIQIYIHTCQSHCNALHYTTTCCNTLQNTA